MIIIMIIIILCFTLKHIIKFIEVGVAVGSKRRWQIEKDVEVGGDAVCYHERSTRTLELTKRHTS